jgi:hypothetical protein
MEADLEHMEFLSLVMAMEALLNVGQTDVQYRVSRSMAVLLGDHLDKSEWVYEQTKRAYDVRSKLVHTGKAKGIEKIWFWGLRSHVQEAILRLISLDITKDELAEKLTRLGFGQARELSTWT